MISRMARFATPRGSSARGSRRLNRNLRRIGDVPDHLEVDVDDVLVAGQHQPGIAARLPRPTPISSVRSRRDRDDLGGDERPGREVQARLAGLAELAEEQLDRALFGLDRVERGEEPQSPARPARRSAMRAAGEPRPAAAAAAGRPPPRPPISTRSCSWPLRMSSSISGICGPSPGPGRRGRRGRHRRRCRRPAAAATPPPPQGPPLFLPSAVSFSLIRSHATSDPT